MTETTQFENRVFKLTADGTDGARLEIATTTEVAGGSPARVIIRPADYEELASETFRAAVKGRKVTLTGRGPLEAYFALAYYSALGGAAEVAVKNPMTEAKTVLSRNSAAPARKPWIRDLGVRDGWSRVELVRAPTNDGKWSDEELGLGVPAALPATSRRLVFTGAGGVVMYAALGVSAALAEVERASIVKPVDNIPVCFAPDKAGFIDGPSSAGERRHGVVLGIVGDPNSGKSVFSKVLSYCVNSIMPVWYKSWIYDCDLASPTPDWYLSGTRPETQDQFQAEKEKIKAKWTPELEETARRNIATLATTLDFVVADMPGGRHPKKENGEDFPPERVHTKSRAAMMAECDAILVVSKGPGILDAWREALGEFGLADRIVAVIDSSEPEGDFECKCAGFGDDGLFHCSVRGLDRTKELQGDAIVSQLSEALAPLVRHLSFMPVASAAMGAVTKSFLTKANGTRYGAAVRSAATGRLFTGGQYASWNHSTNVHAEMSVMVQATEAGEPDIDVVAVACSTSASATPCGVCRQVMAEHAKRTGRDFDVVLVESAHRYKSMKVSELLPLGWVAHPESKKPPKNRKFDCSDAFTDAVPTPGAEFMRQTESAKQITMVWDPLFAPGLVLVKPKYEEAPGCEGFKKLPHAFTEAALYRKYLVDSRMGSTEFIGGAVVGVDPRRRYCNPVPVPAAEAEELDRLVFGPNGVHCADSVRMMGSRALGMQTADSDYDLVVNVTPAQAAAIRSTVAGLIASGAASLPAESGSIKLLEAFLRGNTAAGLAADGRYAETFGIGGRRYSIMFTEAGLADPAIPYGSENCGFTSISGVVVNASRACFKRSVSLVRSDEGGIVRFVCYHKVGNMLKAGDRIAISGTMFRHRQSPTDGCKETLLSLCLDTDKIVWMA